MKTGVFPQQAIDEMPDRLRGLTSKRRAAIKREMDLETRHGQPGYEAYLEAIKEAEKLETEIDKLADEILARPVRSFDDLVVLAELWVALGGKIGNPPEPYRTDAYPPFRTRAVAGAIILGVLKLAGRDKN